jgi:hypothetical protein
LLQTIFMRNEIIFFLCLLFLAGCHSSKKVIHATPGSSSQLKFLSEYDIANGKQFQGTTIGGLSGIDFDAKNEIYYLISDDRSAINPARFYTAKIHIKEDRIDSVEFINTIALLKDGKTYPNSKQDPSHTPDPEEIRYNPVKDEIVWSSEGERKPENNVLEDPSVIIADKSGNYKDSFELPANMHMHATENGPRQNSVFEGLAFSSDHKYVFVSVEEPVYEDGPRAGANDSTAWVRILKFDAETRKQVAQYAYRIEAVAHPAITSNSFKINGVSSILWAGENKLFVVERSFSTGRLACTIRVFLADLNGATDVAHITSLVSKPASTPVSKQLVLNMDDLGTYIDNIEGVTYGPLLSNGHRCLIFVADNNFSPLEKTQFFLFELLP